MYYKPKNNSHKNFRPTLYIFLSATALFVSYIFIINFMFGNLMHINVGSSLEKSKSKTNTNGDIEESKTVISQEDRVSPSTKFTFKILYSKDGNIVEEVKRPTSYDVNLNEEEIKERYKEWKVLSFDSSEVVLEKRVEALAPDYYVIGEKDGYLAVFYKSPEKGLSLREIIDMPIDLLTPIEQNKLKEGILVYGEDDLIRRLEDYSS